MRINAISLVILCYLMIISKSSFAKDDDLAYALLTVFEYEEFYDDIKESDWIVNICHS